MILLVVIALVFLEYDMGSRLDTLRKEYELAVDTINQLD